MDKFAQALPGSIPERLAALWRVDAHDPDYVLALRGIQDGYGVIVSHAHNTLRPLNSAATAG